MNPQTNLAAARWRGWPSGSWIYNIFNVYLRENKVKEAECKGIGSAAQAVRPFNNQFFPN